MKDVGEHLRNADPLTRDEGMSPDDVRRMRRVIVDATRDRAADLAVWWPKPVLVAATVVVTLTGGVAVGRWMSPRDNLRGAERATPSPSVSAARERRQLQFATPGGTRIIWVFDSEFNP